MRTVLKFVVLTFALGGFICSYAADMAVLRNGNSIRHERHEVLGPVTRLYLSDSANGYIEIPNDQILRFENDPDPVPATAESANQTHANSAPQSLVSTATSAKSTPFDRNTLDAVVNSAGKRHQIDPDFINSVIRAESGFNNRAVSKKGARGLMQLMPGTASQLGVANSFDPKANVEGGTTYLRELLEKYNYDVPKALAAYNAGTKRVDHYRGVPPYSETQAYVARIIRDYNRKKLAANPSLAQKSKTLRKTSQISRVAPGAGTKTVAEHSLPQGQRTVSR